MRLAWTDDFGGVPVTNDTRVALTTLAEEYGGSGVTLSGRHPRVRLHDRMGLGNAVGLDLRQLVEDVRGSLRLRTKRR